MGSFKKIPLLLAGLAVLTACAGAPQGETNPVRRVAAAAFPHSGTEYEAPAPRYTRADYRLLESLRTEDYRDRPLDAFNAALLDWTDEDAFHRNEEALQRLDRSLPGDDPLRPFLDGTVSASWNECQRRHYSACPQRQTPTAGGSLSRERLADVYGDQVATAWAWADFWYGYTPGASVTVGERDDFLQAVEQGMQAYLEDRSWEQCKGQKTMERSLLAELKRLTTAQGGQSFPTGGWEVVYQFETVGD